MDIRAARGDSAPMPNDNSEQVAYWNGPSGARWVEVQADLDRALAPLGTDAIASLDLAPGERVLDVGCGCGDTVLALARAADGVRVTGVDVSAPMLGRAVERVAAAGLGDRVTLVEADAASAELPEVDALFSRFGVMFFADPREAFGHLRAALRPAGRAVFLCWRGPADNPWARLTMQALASVLGPLPRADPHAPGPFALADGDRLRGILAGAGFADIALHPVTRALQWTTSGGDDELRRFLRVGPAARMLAELTADVRERAAEAVLDAIRPHVRPDGLWLEASAWRVTARAGTS